LAISALGGLISGFNPAIMSPAGSLIQHEFFVVEPVLQGFVTSIMLFGALVGSFAAGAMATRLGRRYTAIIATGICLFGGASPAFSTDLYMFLALRFVLGLGVGVVGVICPLYVSEVVPVSKKGKYGVVFQLTLTLGILLAYLVGYIFTKVIDRPSLQWRLMLSSFGVILPLILLVLIVVGMKETQNEGQVGENTNLQINKEDQVLSKTGGWLGLLVPRRFVKQTLTGIVLAMTLQLTGVNAIIYFGTKILAEAFPGSKAALLNIAIGGWNFIATFIALYLVDRLRRSVLMTGATVIIAVALFIVGVCFDKINDPLYRGIGIGVGLFLFIGGFEAGPGCLFWILANEIFDKNVLAEGASSVNVLQWAFNLVVSTLFPLLFDSQIGAPGTFYLFGSIGILCALYLFFFLKVPNERE